MNQKAHTHLHEDAEGAGRMPGIRSGAIRCLCGENHRFGS